MLCVLVIISHSLCLFTFVLLLSSVPQLSAEKLRANGKVDVGQDLELAFSFLQIILSFLRRCKTTVNEFCSLGLFGRSLGFPRASWIRAYLWPWTDVGSPLLSPGAWYRTSLFLEWMCNLLQLIHMHCLNSELKEVLKIIYLLHLIGEATGQEHVGGLTASRVHSSSGHHGSTVSAANHCGFTAARVCAVRLQFCRLVLHLLSTALGRLELEWLFLFAFSVGALRSPS